MNIGGRWISSKRTLRKAQWLAVARMRPIHDGFRVRWRFAHSSNFALRALRDGFKEETILRAWRLAVERSHEDACDQDLRERPNPDDPHPQREPSAAVVYAWQELRTDKRTREERWSEIFTLTRAPRPAPAPQVKRSPPVSKPRPATDAGKLRGGGVPDPAAKVLPAELPDEKIAAQKTIEAHLAAAGMTLQDLLKKSRPEQAAFLAAALGSQKKRN